MKIKDSTVITLLIFVTMLIFIGVIGTENEMDRMEKQINEVYEHEMENLRRISALEDIPDRVAYLEKMSQFHQDRLDYLSDTIALNKSESSTRFDDLLHEVNAYEEAVNGLSVVQIIMSDEPVGTWKYERDIDAPLFMKDRWRCPVCNSWQTYGQPKHCPECGARLEREEKKNE